MIKIIAISDLHGFLPDYSNYSGDVFCICGDISPLNIQRSEQRLKKWYLNEFIPWCNKLDCSHVIWIPGNHDCIIENDIEWFTAQNQEQEKVTMLLDTMYVHKKDDKLYSFYGTPWCKEFYNWAFMIPNNELIEKFSNIPNNLDVLLTHDVPYGYADIIEQPIEWNTGEHIGNKPLKDAIMEKQPKIHISGHLHSCTHNEVLVGSTKHYNASIVDEYYNLSYLPQVITYDV